MALTFEATVATPGRVALGWRKYRTDILWWVFVLINVWAIVMLRVWATVPFHFIWIGVSLMYGWRVWSMKVTVISLGVIVVLTGAPLLYDVLHGYQEPDELTEIPLMSAVFLVMVLYVQRRVAAQEETERIAARNLALVEQGRTLVQNASHVLRTPLTIALGHAELLQRSALGPESSSDAGVVVAELNRLKGVTDRFLQLAKSEQPDYLYPIETDLGLLVRRMATRWVATQPGISVGVVEDIVMWADPDRVGEALDEMIGNAIAHCPAGTSVEISAKLRGNNYAISVADRGPGIPESMAATIFDRFSHGSGTGRRGSGLGLAIVKAITDGHGGHASVRNRSGGGAEVEMSLPISFTSREASDEPI